MNKTCYQTFNSFWNWSGLAEIDQESFINVTRWVMWLISNLISSYTGKNIIILAMILLLLKHVPKFYNTLVHKKYSIKFKQYIELEKLQDVII